MKRYPDAAYVATIAGLLAMVVGGGIWVGGIEVKADSAVLTAAKVEQIKLDQAVIKQQIKQILQAGLKRDGKLDRLLEAIQIRNARVQ